MNKLMIRIIAAAMLVAACGATNVALADGTSRKGNRSHATAKNGAKKGAAQGTKQGLKDGLKYGLKNGLKDGLKNGAKK